VDPENASSDKVDHGGQPSFPPSPAHRDGSVIGTQFGSQDPYPDITDFKGQPPLSPAASEKWERVLDPK